MLLQVTRDKIFFSDLQNSFLDFAANLGFVNLFGIYKKIFIFTQAVRPGFSFRLSFFFSAFSHKSLSGL